MKDPMERMGDVIDRLTNENAELKAENESYKAAICFETTCTNCASMLDQLAEMEATLERKESSLNTYRRSYNEGWK